jgi:hypothetical protein
MTCPHFSPRDYCAARECPNHQDQVAEKPPFFGVAMLIALVFLVGAAMLDDRDRQSTCQAVMPTNRSPIHRTHP